MNAARRDAADMMYDRIDQRGLVGGVRNARPVDGRAAQYRSQGVKLRRPTFDAWETLPVTRPDSARLVVVATVAVAAWRSRRFMGPASAPDSAGSRSRPKSVG